MPKEISAGAIIYTRIHGEIKYLLLHYEAGHWDFVKGNIEEGEEEKETLKREIEEETGIRDIKFIENFKEKVNWFYKREGKTIFKEVIFYLIETKEKDIRLSSEHIGFKWLCFKDAMEQLNFKNSKELLRKADEVLSRLD